MKKYLITGATGFLGSNLTKKLLSDGNEVHCIVRETSNLWRLNNIKEILKSPSSLTLHRTNLLNYEELKALIKKERFNIIIHTATFGGFYYEKDEREIFNTNVISLFNLMKASENSSIELIINTSSSSEYGEKLEPMSEDMLLNPNNFYGATKAASTLLASTLSKLHRVPLVTLRVFSPYGFYDGFERLIPYTILKAITNQDIILSNITGKRDYIFINDVLNAYVKAIDLENTYGEILNLGTGTEHTVMDVVNEILKETHSKSNIILDKNSKRQYEPSTWVSSQEKCNEILKTNDIIPLNKGLKETIDWFKRNKHLYNL